MNPLKQGFLRVAGERLKLPAGPVEVELGCADARFLFERAALQQETTYVGVEIRREMVDRVRRRAQAEGLSRLYAVFANMNTDLLALFGPEQIDRVFLNFPDPWFKRAQHKRRVVQPELAQGLVQVVRPGGEVFFQSDIFELALDAMSVLEQTPGLLNIHGEWSFARTNPYGAQSLREVRVLEKGLPVWRICYRKIQADR